MAANTVTGSALENNLPVRYYASRLVAVSASDRPVSAAQSKPGARVVESPYIFPGARGVANGAVVFRLRYRLPLVRVRVAAATGQSIELVLRRRRRIAARRRLVAFAAGRGRMPAG